MLMKKILFFILFFYGLTFGNKVAGFGIAVNPLNLIKKIYTVEMTYWEVIGVQGTYLFFSEESSDYFFDVHAFLNFDVKGTWLPDPLYLYWGGGYAYTVGELKNSVNHTRITMHRVFGRGGLRLDFFILLHQNSRKFRIHC